VDGKAVSLTRAGDSADVTLAGIDATAVGSGSVLCHPDFPVQLVTRWASACVRVWAVMEADRAALMQSRAACCQGDGS
jgi:hypothetical protein